MKRTVLYSCRTLLCTVLLAGLAVPGYALDLNGYFPSRGSGDVALSWTTESYDHFWAGERKVSNPGVGEVETRSLSLWLQYGFTESFALVAEMPYVDATSDGLGGFEDSGVQDLSVLGRFRFATVEAGGVRHGFSAAVGGRTAVGDYEADQPVSLGDGTSDGLFRFVYQLEAGSFYLSQQIGYDLRGGDVPNGFPLYTEAGYTFGRLTVNGFYLQYIADGGSDIGDPGFTFPSNQEEYQRVGLKLYARVGQRFGVSAGGFTTLDGRNSGDASGFSAGLVARF